MPRPTTAHYHARWGYRELDGGRYEQRRYGGLAELNRGPVVGTVCHPYTMKSFGRAVRRAIGVKAKRSTRLRLTDVVAEASAAGLVVERVIPVLSFLSEVWVVVLRMPSAPL